MSRAVGVALAALIAGCGSLPTTSEGAAFLQIQLPTNGTIEVGATLQLHAQAIDKSGNPIDIPILWRTPDTTISVGAGTGLVTGLFPGSGRVQAVIGDEELVTDFLTITVAEPPAALRRP